MKEIILGNTPIKYSITYKKNIWHHPLLVRKNQDFWIVDRIKKNENPAINLKEYHFKENQIRHLIF